MEDKGALGAPFFFALTLIYWAYEQPLVLPQLMHL